MDEWIVTREAASRLGVTPARIRQLVAENKLTAKKLGGKYRGQWLVKASEVQKRLEAKGVISTMRVKSRMTPNPIVASPKTTYNEALRMMQQNDIKHLPILDKKNKLVGIVTRSDMLGAKPSGVSTLSVYEIASLLEKVTMSQIMSKPVMAVEEDCSIANAASYMLEHGISCLPVVREDEVVGIITDSDIFKTFVEVTGGGQAGSRVEVRMPDEKGYLAKFVNAFAEADSYIVSVAITYDDTGEYCYVDLKERGGDEELLREKLEELEDIDIIEFFPSDHEGVCKFE
jgi:acetoin utilization protein AcuB